MTTQIGATTEDCSVVRKEGGTIASNARKALEKKSGKKVISKKNYLSKGERKQIR